MLEQSNHLFSAIFQLRFWKRKTVTTGSFSTIYIHGAAWSAKSDPFSYSCLTTNGLDDKNKES